MSAPTGDRTARRVLTGAPERPLTKPADRARAEEWSCEGFLEALLQTGVGSREVSVVLAGYGLIDLA